MKKISAWAEKNKFQLMVAAFIVVTIMLIIVFIGSLKKDHSLDLTNQKLILEEKHRVLIEEERKEHQKVVDAKDEFIRAQEDSLLINDLKGKNLNKQQNEKFKAINNFGSDELRDYFRNLRPTDNDY